MMFAEKYPLEKFIISVMKKCRFNVDTITSEVYKKYPFFNYRELKIVVASLMEKKINNEKLGGVWIKRGKELKMQSMEYHDLAHDGPKLWDDAPTPSDMGNANRLYVSPQTDFGPDRYEVPKKDDIKEVYNKIKKSIQEKLQTVTERQLNKITIDEMKNLGYTQEQLSKLNFGDK